jgi:multiple sugar transport system permease protein
VSSLDPPATGRALAAVRGLSASVRDVNFAQVAVWPAVGTLALVTLVPIAIGVGLSFTSYNLSRPDRMAFIGTQNYQDLFSDPSLPQVLITTLLFVGGLVTVETLVGLGLALLLARQVRGIGVFRTLYLLPVMTAGIAVAITWRYLLNGNYGWVNYFLGLIGLPQPQWLATSGTALPSLVIADMWVGAPFMAMLILAGLLSVPEEPIEAAQVDGASALQIFWFVLLPAIRPVLAIAVLLRTIDAFKKFELIQVMTAGGPGIGTTILNYYVYKQAFVFGRLGYAACLAVVLFVLMAVVMIALLRVGGFMQPQSSRG